MKKPSNILCEILYESKGIKLKQSEKYFFNDLYKNKGIKSIKEFFSVIDTRYIDIKKNSIELQEIISNFKKKL